MPNIVIMYKLNISFYVSIFFTIQFLYDEIYNQTQLVTQYYNNHMLRCSFILGHNLKTNISL